MRGPLTINDNNSYRIKKITITIIIIIVVIQLHGHTRYNRSHYTHSLRSMYKSAWRVLSSANGGKEEETKVKSHVTSRAEKMYTARNSRKGGAGGREREKSRVGDYMKFAQRVTDCLCLSSSVVRDSPVRRKYLK